MIASQLTGLLPCLSEQQLPAGATSSRSIIDAHLQLCASLPENYAGFCLLPAMLASFLLIFFLQSEHSTCLAEGIEGIGAWSW